MGRAPEDCPPICAQVGHHLVTMAVWRCQHTGRISGGYVRYHETGGEPVVLEQVELDAGPFTAQDDLHGWLVSLVESVELLSRDDL